MCGFSLAWCPWNVDVRCQKCRLQATKHQSLSKTNLADQALNRMAQTARAMVLLAFLLIGLGGITHRHPFVDSSDDGLDGGQIDTSFVVPHMANFAGSRGLSLNSHIVMKAKEKDKQQCEAQCGAASSSCCAGCTRSPPPLRGPCMALCGSAFVACMASC